MNHSLFTGHPGFITILKHPLLLKVGSHTSFQQWENLAWLLSNLFVLLVKHSSKEKVILLHMESHFSYR